MQFCRRAGRLQSISRPLFLVSRMASTSQTAKETASYVISHEGHHLVLVQAKNIGPVKNPNVFFVSS